MKPACIAACLPRHASHHSQRVLPSLWVKCRFHRWTHLGASQSNLIVDHAPPEVPEVMEGMRKQPKNLGKFRGIFRGKFRGGIKDGDLFLTGSPIPGEASARRGQRWKTASPLFYGLLHGMRMTTAAGHSTGSHSR